jgi:imidazoleglycerol-phosphate dehydratase / histidinol-phosphatase
VKERILFIDRDGTLIVEPPETHQVDSLEKLELIPGAVEEMARIMRQTRYRFVLVTNQDGLGTESFPEENFWPAHHRMLEFFKAVGVTFHDMLIDRSFPHENSPNRKPEIGLVRKYMTPRFDLAASFCIGDRLTDMELAKNVGAQGIWLRTGAVPSELGELEQKGLKETVALVTQSWQEVSAFLIKKEKAL